ncbi:MAG: TIGR02147 family protein [Bdellovibrionales bacterium]|nr:TIGR02147 family protein [Bdellovibrionales bacterium]
METMLGGSGPKISIFAFADFREYLKAAGLPDGPYSHQHNNLSRWAKRLGYRSPSSLAMVLNGQRLPSAEMIHALCQDLRLDPTEREYLNTLILLEKAKRRGRDPGALLERIASLAHPSTQPSLTLEQFRLVADWYFLAIKNLAALADFEENPNWIRRRLRNKVTTPQIEYALKTLENLGLLRRDSSGVLRPNGEPWNTGQECPSAAVRRHHGGMIQRALEAIEEQEPAERHLLGLSMRLSPPRLNEAKTRLHEFVESFNRDFFEPDGTEIYQLNLQLFALTNGPSKKGLDQ